jgi:hypothetical protein
MGISSLDNLASNIPPPDYFFYFSMSKIVVDRIYGHILDKPQKKIMYPRKK